MTVEKKVPFKKRELFTLRAVLKGCAEEAAGIRKEIHKTERGEKWHNWNRKRHLGQYARHHLVAYGFLTGRAYKELEKDCEDKRLRTQSAIIPAYKSLDLEVLLAICKLHAPSLFWQYNPRKLTVADLRAWIEEGTPFFLTKEEVLAKKKAQDFQKSIGLRQSA